MNDKSKTVILMLNPDYDTPEFRPYVLAVGHVALAWNGWHDALAVLFSVVCGDKSSRLFGNIWNSIKSDRAQREMLAAATNGVFHTNPNDSDRVKEDSARIKDDIAWMLNKGDDLEDFRNDIVHSPLIVRSGEDNKLLIEPNSYIGHRRALKLSNKNEFLRECDWFKKAALVLRELASEMYEALDEKTPWPARPKWPNRGDSSGSAQIRPTSLIKPSPRRPSSHP